MSHRNLLATLGLVTLGWFTFPETVSAEPIAGLRPEVHVGFGGYGSVGAGFRLDIPIVPGGMLRGTRVDDELALSPGFDFAFVDFDDDQDGDGDLLFVPQLAVQWNFYFPRDWSIAPELGLAVAIGDDHFGFRGGDRGVYVDPLVAFVARHHFRQRLALVMRLGFPVGFQVGVAF